MDVQDIDDGPQTTDDKELEKDSSLKIQEDKEKIQGSLKLKDTRHKELAGC